MYLDAKKIPRPSSSRVRDERVIPQSSAKIRFCLYMANAVSDSLALIMGFALALLVTVGPAYIERLYPFVSIIPLYIIVALFSGAYAHDALVAVHVSWARAAKAFALTFLVTIFVASALSVSFPLSRGVLWGGLGLSMLLGMIGRAVVNLFAHRWAKGQVISRLLIIDGVTPGKTPAGYRVFDCAQSDLAPSSTDPVMLNRLARMLSHVDRIVVSCVPDRRENWAAVLKGLGVDGGLLMPELEALGMQYSSIAPGHPVILVSRGPLSLRNRALKRALDLTLTVPALIVLALPMAIVAILIKLDSPGSIFFKQPRIGQRNYMFEIHKFRSMRSESRDEDGTISTRRDDDRITRVGKVLRRTSIDELPQLFNVLIGDMSLVGPRPHAVQSRADHMLFWEIDSRYFLRHASKPGITGLAQVQGFRGATERTIDLTARLQADLNYAAQWSIWLDIAILVRTVRVMMHKNAY